jgi:hypothetical protein
LIHFIDLPTSPLRKQHLMPVVGLIQIDDRRFNFFQTTFPVNSQLSYHARIPYTLQCFPCSFHFFLYFSPFFKIPPPLCLFYSFSYIITLKAFRKIIKFPLLKKNIAPCIYYDLSQDSVLHCIFLENSSCNH